MFGFGAIATGSSDLVTNPKKSLGVYALVMINIIAVDSLRSLPFSAEFGFTLVFYYLLAGLFFLLPIALVSAELATTFPNRGGIYIWVREAFGEFWGFYVIWMLWVYNVAWYPTILSFIAGAIAYILQPGLAENKLFILPVIMTIFWGATFINCYGMRLSSWVSEAGAVFGTIIPMLLVIVLAVIWVFRGQPIQIEFSWQTFFPDFSHPNMFPYLTALLFGLVGIEMSAVHADEVKDPGRAYPRAILYSTTFILTSLTLSSLAIAIVVPHTDLSVYTGLLQALEIFLTSLHMKWALPIITLLIIFGGIGSVATWIIGPTKGLFVAAQDGNAPAILAQVNDKNVPIMILLIQATIFTVLCTVFVLMPTVASSYWVLTAITAQLAMLVYLALFAAAVSLRYSQPDVARPFKIPGGNVGIWVASIFGVISCAIAIFLGFVPPATVHVGRLWVYEAVLLFGIIVLSSPPVVMYFRYHRDNSADKTS